MLKLIAHAVVAAALIVAGKALGWSVWLVGVAVIAGATLVHLAWERFSPAAPGHLGAVPIASDDPRMLAALERARETWGDFTRLFPEHRENSMVKFRLRTDEGEVENVWGELIELDEDRATVRLRTPPVGPVTIPGDPERLVIPVSDVVDWQIVFPDNTLRGGFTQRATFEIWEREAGSLPRKLRVQQQRYRELESDAGGGRHDD